MPGIAGIFRQVGTLSLHAGRKFLDLDTVSASNRVILPLLLQNSRNRSLPPLRILHKQLRALGTRRKQSLHTHALVINFRQYRR